MNKSFLKTFGFLCLIIFFVASFFPTSLLAAQASSTSYILDDFLSGAGSSMSSTNFSLTGAASQSSTGFWSTNSVPLAAGTITSCGKITSSGTYILNSDISGISGTCFTVLANNVTIDGGGHTITASAGNTSYAVMATSSTLSGGSGYSTTTVQNMTFASFAGGVNASGNNNVSGAGGNGGNVYVASSTMGAIVSSGGSGSNSGNGGVGGNVSISNSSVGNITTSGLTNGSVYISGTNLNLSNKTYTTDVLDLSYSGTLTTTSTTLSALTNFTINSTSLGSYVGGAFPLIPGTINSCGTIYFAGTYTLGGNISGNCNISHSSVTLSGAGNILTGNITANSYGVTFSNITVTGSVSTTGASPGALTFNNASNVTGSVSSTGVINGDGSSSLGNTTINTGASVATSSVSFVGDVVNNGTIYPGNSVLGKTTNNTNIIGDFTFNASSTNSGTVYGNAILNASSTNTGTITGTATFNMYTTSGGAVSFSGTTSFGGTGYVTGNIYDSGSVQITSWIFNASSTNAGYTKGNAVFNNTSRNNSGATILGNATFNDTSTNLGIVTGNSTVNSPVVRPLGGTTNGQVIYYGYAGLYFNDTAAGHGVSGKWDDINNWWTDVTFSTHSPIIPTEGDDVIIYGNITLTSTPAVIKTIIFQATSTNSINIYLSGTSTDAAMFNASSTNAGTIYGSATFSGPDTTNSGTVTGYITRQYNAGVYTVLLDFTHNGGHWIVQAINGAAVDLSSAIYSLVNNTFQALNNGFFSAWNNAISGGSAGNPNLVITTPTTGTNIKWAPNISWGTSSLCQYKIDGGTYTSVVCSNNGSDIPRPTASSHIIFFKSTDGGNVTEKSVSFTYDNTQPIDTDCASPLDEATRPYYYLTSNVGNCTITASTALRGDDNGGGHFYTVGNITGSSTNISLVNITATGTVSSFNNITVSSSTISGTTTINGTFDSDNLSRFVNVVVQSGGNVRGGTFTGTLTNNSGGTITNSTTTPVTVLLSTTNSGTITGGFIFNATSTNTGTVSGTTTFNGASINGGTVNGNTTLEGSSVNSGTINGDLTFGTLLSSNGTITFTGNTAFPGTNIVSGNVRDYQGNIITRWIFNNSSSNLGTTKGNSFFNNSSINYGTVSGDAYFSDASINSGAVTGDANVYYSVSTPLTGTVNGTTTYHSYPNAPSFNNAAGDNSWNNVSNWFTDTTFATQLGRTPVAGENIVLFASTTLPSDITNNIFFAVGSSTLSGAGHKVSGNISGNGAYGGYDALNFNLENIIVTGTTTAIGGDGTATVNGGKGGVINIATSSTWVVAVNGGDPQHNGGDAGEATIVNSYAYQDGTPILAVGGNSVGCGYGGSGGNITLIDSSGYNLITDTGLDATTTIAQGGGCANPPTPPTGRSSGHVSTVGVYHAPVTTSVSTPVVAKSSSNQAYSPFVQKILLPVQFIKSLFLKPVPKFGDTENGKTFSFIKLVTNFLFVPINNNITDKLGTDLLSYLKFAGFSKENDLLKLKNNPITLPNTNKDIKGLYKVSVEGLPVKLPGQVFTKNTSLDVSSVFGTSDMKNFFQKVSLNPKTTFTINLVPTNKGTMTAKFNNRNFVFKGNSLTLTTPLKPGIYKLTTSGSPLSLMIEVKNTEPVKTAPDVTTTNWFTKVLDFFWK